MKYLTILVLAATVGLTACSTHSVTTGDGDKVKYQVVATGGTKDRLDILSVVAAKAGDLSRASVELQNDSNFAYTFEYRFKWYDAAGMEISPDSTGWTPVSIMAHEMKSLQSLAPNPTGATFKLFLQEKQ